MAKEIEHKYLVKEMSFGDFVVDKREIIQGYLSRDPERTVRVRIAGDRAFLTVKGISDKDTRLELEYSIPEQDALEMLAIALPGIIKKTRYVVSYKGWLWEIDEFHGDREGLVVAEIELDASHYDYPLPPFIGKEVTGDPAYYNSNL